ncbi:MAG: tRNA (N(6)-L-threonylcarbamoyladenosine(37)-C(2))-methylthiotransferase [Asgard group archaeon]|nr:tRNA (N(6)-L-threonylcarbamoyladenosine(37)-C(2))-methylthiotransferase [Asgard group archaeon]
MSKSQKLSPINVPNFYVETFGCTANTSATELMTYLLIECGHKKVDTKENADFCLINTCIVKAPTENKIKDLLIKLNKKLPLIIAGCLPQVLSDWCRQHMPNVPLIGVDHFDMVCNAAKNAIEGKSYSAIQRNEEFCSEIKRKRELDKVGIIEISKGCMGNCSYCIVKIAKGIHVSKQEEQILEEVRNALNEGCTEFWLTAQDTASYGIELGINLPTIVKKICSIPEEFRIRIGMMNTDFALKILDELKDVLQHSKTFKFVHIPVQSGSNIVLQKMRRKYTIDEFIFLIKSLREIPKITISTDIIAGFPEETEEDHELTKQLISDIKFDIINISKYGDRKGTEASRSQEKLPTEIVKQRSSELKIIADKISLENNKNWIGWKGTALAVKYSDDNTQTILRNDSYKVVAIEKSDLTIGEWYKVEIIDATKTRLIGTLIE